MESHYAKTKLDDIALSAAPMRTVKTLNDSSGYPYSVVLDDITGFSASNQSDANAVTFTLTLEDASVMTIPVVAGDSYFSEYESNISTIAVSGTSPDFAAELLRRVL